MGHGATLRPGKLERFASLCPKPRVSGKRHFATRPDGCTKKGRRIGSGALFRRFDFRAAGYCAGAGAASVSASSAAASGSSAAPDMAFSIVSICDFRAGSS